MRILGLIKNIRNWPQYLAYKFFTRRHNPFIFHCAGDIYLEVPPRLMHTFKEAFLEEGYLAGFPKNLFSGNPTVLDIGANVGYFSFYFLSRYPQTSLYAYEPVEKNFRLFEKYRTAHPSFKLHIFNLAVSDQPGNLTLHLDNQDSFTTSASVFETNDGTDTVEVRASTLIEIMSAHSLEKIHLLKLDCEGAEYRILYNCPVSVFRKIQAITLETHEGKLKEENKDDLVHFLTSQGYRVHTDSSDLVRAWRKED